MKVSKKLSVVLVLVAVGLMGREAAAMSRHEKVTVTAIKEKGEVVGAKIKLTLRPSNNNHTVVRIGIGPMGAKPAGDHRKAASDKSAGYLLHQFKEIKGLENSKPKEVELTIKFKDAPKLKAYGAYSFPFGLVTGFSGQYASGAPISKFGYHTYGSPRFVAPRGSAGSSLRSICA